MATCAKLAVFLCMLFDPASRSLVEDPPSGAHLERVIAERSLCIRGGFRISPTGHESNLTHHIHIKGNTLVGQNGGQQTVGISTKTPPWGWIIRNNRIVGAGTGLYLGESDGTQPFVSGLIENN